MSMQVGNMTFQSNMKLLDVIGVLQMSLVSNNNEQANALLAEDIF